MSILSQWLGVCIVSTEVSKTVLDSGMEYIKNILNIVICISSETFASIKKIPKLIVAEIHSIMYITKNLAKDKINGEHPDINICSR
jgi:hypothetical protein